MFIEGSGGNERLRASLGADAVKEPPIFWARLDRILALTRKFIMVRKTPLVQYIYGSVAVG